MITVESFPSLLFKLLLQFRLLSLIFSERKTWCASSLKESTKILISEWPVMFNINWKFQRLLVFTANSSLLFKELKWALLSQIVRFSSLTLLSKLKIKSTSTLLVEVKLQRKNKNSMALISMLISLISTSDSSWKTMQDLKRSVWNTALEKC